VPNRDVQEEMAVRDDCWWGTKERVGWEIGPIILGGGPPESSAHVEVGLEKGSGWGLISTPQGATTS